MTADSARRAALGCILASASGSTAPPWLIDLVEEGLAGVSLFATNVTSDGQGVVPPFARQIRDARADTIVAVDEEGGDVTRLAVTNGSVLPSHAILGHLDETETTHRTAERIGRNLAARHINLNFAPCADVNSADGNPVIGSRSFSASPDRVATHVRSYINGLHAAGVASCTKHFPGHGSTSVDSHLMLPIIDDPFGTIQARDLPPFEAAIDGGTDSIMLGHLHLPHFGNLPTSQNPALISWLRNDLKFAGVIITDALDMEAVSDGAHLGPAAVASLAAGNDLLCLGSNLKHHQVEAVIDHIVDAVAAGTISIDDLEASAQRNVTLASRRDGSTGTPWPATDTEFGAAVAISALEISGSLDGLAHPVIIECRPEASIAATQTMWGIAHLVENDHWPAEVHRIYAGDGPLQSDIFSGRPVVVVVRNLVAAPWQRNVIKQAADASHLVVVELGWPVVPDQPHDGFIASRSASQASCRAVASLLEAHHGDALADRNRDNNG